MKVDKKLWATYFVMIMVFAFLLVLVVGCGDDAPTQGYVQSTKYEPSHEESHWVPGQCFSYDKYGGCSFRMPGHTEYEQVPDKWFLYLQDCHANDKGKQDCHEGWMQVDETTFHSYKVGQHYPDAR